MSCCGKGPYEEEPFIRDELNKIFEESGYKPGLSVECKTCGTLIILRKLPTVTMEEIDKKRNSALKLLEMERKTFSKSVARVCRMQVDELSMEIVKMLRIYREEHGL